MKFPALDAGLQFIIITNVNLSKLFISTNLNENWYIKFSFNIKIKTGAARPSGKLAL